jgi:plastocyanin
MSLRTIPVIGLAILMLVAISGCADAGVTQATIAPVAAAPTPAGACSATSDAGAVAVSIKGFAFNPADIQAKVGEVIQFTNDDSTGHTASLTDGSCTTPTIGGGATGGLVFSQAGTYPFRCNIHKQMTGTITIS